LPAAEAHETTQASARFLYAVALVVAAGLLLCLPLILAARAAAYVYWTDSSGAAIGRAALDGSGADPGFISTHGVPEAIAVNPKHIYWTNATDAVGRARIDGTGIDHEFIKGTGTVSGVAVGSGHVYWSNRDDGTIGRAKLNGTGVDQDFIGGAAAPGHMAVDGSRIYWANPGAGAIGRARLDGTGVKQDFIATLGHPAGLTVDDDHVYWVNANITPDFHGAIGRAGLDGGNPDQTFTTSAMAPSFGFLSGLAVDAGHIYWADFSYPSVVRAGLDGDDVEPGFIATGMFTFPRDVAVDPLPRDESAPETTIVGRPPNSIRRSTARYRFTASEPGSSFECRRDRRPFRPCAAPKLLRKLSAGRHRFAVRATDEAGNVDPSPARDRFRVRRADAHAAASRR
jgi:hypothetical protein